MPPVMRLLLWGTEAACIYDRAARLVVVAPEDAEVERRDAGHAAASVPFSSAGPRPLRVCFPPALQLLPLGVLVCVWFASLQEPEKNMSCSRMLSNHLRTPPFFFRTKIV